MACGHEENADVNAVHSGGNWFATNSTTSLYAGHKGKTPLIYAVSKGSTKLVKLLMEAGADINYRFIDSKGVEKGVADFAKGKRGEKVVKILETA